MSAVLDETRPTLPVGWYWATMGDIAEVVGGGTPRTNDVTNFDGGEVPWITPADLSGYADKHIAHGARYITRKGLESSSARMVPAGTVLFTSRAPIGYVAIARNPVATNQGFKSFVLKEGVLPEYVYWWLKGSKQRAEALASGTTFLELSGANAKKLPIPIAPLDEQRRIVAEIEKQFSRLDEAVTSLKRVKANLIRFGAAVLAQAINGADVGSCQDGSAAIESGTDLLRRIFNDRAQVRPSKSSKRAPVPPSDIGGLPVLPATWAWASLDQIGQEGRSVIYGIIKPGPDTPGGVPYVRVTEMKDGYVDVPSLRRAAREREAKFSRARLLPGDLLISKDGTIGRVAVVPPDLEGGNITQHVMRAPIHRFINRDFVVYAIRSELCQRWLMGQTRGVALRGVNVEDFRRLPIPVPPRSEQDRIVAEVDRRLSIVREVEAEVDANLKRAQALRQAVLVCALLPVALEEPLEAAART